jgi:23S rRNA pseudouridine2605 synthase
MRLNQFIARATGMSRRAADAAISQQRVKINGQIARLGQPTEKDDTITLDGVRLSAITETQTIMLNKPIGYVVSRNAQGGRSVYELLDPELYDLKPIGRLDKNSSGLLMLSNDGDLAQRLTHPKFEKIKKYKIALNKNLADEDFIKITQQGVELEDGISKFDLIKINNQTKEWKVSMKEGRNRQIRRTFEHLGYRVVKLHRTVFGDFNLPPNLRPGDYINV